MNEQTVNKNNGADDRKMQKKTKTLLMLCHNLRIRKDKMLAYRLLSCILYDLNA